MTNKIEKSEARLDEILEENSEELAEKRAVLVDAQAKEQPYTTRLSEEQSQLDIVRTEADVIRKSNADAENELQQGRQAVEMAEADRDQLIKKYKETKKEYKEARKAYDEGEANVNQLIHCRHGWKRASRNTGPW